MTNTFPDVLRLSVNEGGSGRGMSFWSGAAVCGKQALFYEARKAAQLADPTRAPVFDATKKNAFAVGSAYHKLHEFWRKDLLSQTTLDFNEPINDASIAFALHLFREYRGFWDRDLWGKAVATEVTLPVSEWAIAVLLELFGVVINAKPDHVTYLDERALDRARSARNVQGLMNPGYYLIDFKTAGSDYGAEYYTEGLQSYWYPFAWDLDNPDLPVEGTIFDVLRKPDPRRKDQSLSPESFSAYFAPVRDREYTIQIIKGLIEQGRANIERAEVKNLGNRAACHKIEFGQLTKCPFLGNECGGF